MTRGSLSLAVAGALAILAAVAAGVLAIRGGRPEVILGAGIGTGLGAGGALLEALLIHRALRLRRGTALGIVLGGFLLRLVVLAALSFALAELRFADAAAFALCFLGGFLASLPLLAVAVSDPVPVEAGPGNAGPGKAGEGRA